MQCFISWMLSLLIALMVWPINGMADDKTTVALELSATSPKSGFYPDNEILTPLFNEYEANTNALVKIFATMMRKGGTDFLWTKARRITEALKKYSFQLLQLGKEYNNPTWEYYASNLYHHCLELEEATLKNNGEESLLLVSILVNHIGQIQSANPSWLVWHVGEQIKILESGVQNRDTIRVRDAAEIIHTSASKILLSSSIVPEIYAYLNWRRNIIRLNDLGDSILGEVNQGDWSGVQQKVTMIKYLYARWKQGFKVPAHEQ